MRTTGQIRAELPADLEEAEREAMVALALRLEATRPAPALEFEAGLRRRLLPRRLSFARSPRVLAGAYAAGGCLLLAIAAAGLAGIGPFAA